MAALPPIRPERFISIFPEKNDGETPYTLTVKDVPVDGYWSISVYNADGYFEGNPQGGYALNSITAKKEPDGSYLIHFGGDATQLNWLFTPEGWNYTVRLYLPREEILSGAWIFPAAVDAKAN